jgi:hypothetical protein
MLTSGFDSPSTPGWHPGPNVSARPDELDWDTFTTEPSAFAVIAIQSFESLVSRHIRDTVRYPNRCEGNDWSTTRTASCSLARAPGREAPTALLAVEGSSCTPPLELFACSCTLLH